MTGKFTPDVELWRAKQAQGQGALDVLLALKQGGAEKTDDLVSQVANINNYRADPQNKYGVNVNSDIEKSKDVVKNYKGAVDKYNASPSRQKQFLEEQTADEMKDEIIKGFFEAMNYTDDPREKAQIYARTKSALHGIDVAYKRREGSGDLLGQLSDYTKSPGGGGGVGGKYFTFTEEGPEMRSHVVLVPTGEKLPAKYAENFLSKTYNRKIALNSANFTASDQATTEADRMILEKTINDKREKWQEVLNGKWEFTGGKGKAVAEMEAEGYTAKKHPSGKWVVYYTGRGGSVSIPQKSNVNTVEDLMNKYK